MRHDFSSMFAAFSGNFYMMRDHLGKRKLPNDYIRHGQVVQQSFGGNTVAARVGWRVSANVADTLHAAYPRCQAQGTRHDNGWPRRQQARWRVRRRAARFRRAGRRMPAAATTPARDSAMRAHASYLVR
jgi:hypothetical protein